MIKLEFLENIEGYKKGEIYSVRYKDAIRFLKWGSADVYHEKYEKAIKK